MEEGPPVEGDAQTDDLDSVEDTLQETCTDLEGTELDDDGNGSETAAHEVFVGGLPPDANDEDVKQAFEAAGEVLSVRLNRRKKTGECKGFGFVRFGDPETAEKATIEVKEVCGRQVGVHISRGRTADQQLVPESSPPVGDDSDPESNISKLLTLLRTHTDKRAAVNAALKAVMKLPPRPKASESSEPRGADDTGSQHDLERPGSSGDVGLDNYRGRREDEPPLPDPQTFLEAYPKCRHLVETFRANPNTHNKTPLAILHEYATRLNLELTYTESATSNLGPFTVEAKLSSVGGAVTYATGSGRGRGKKDAKQVGAAAVLEMLLVTVPEADFLQPGKAKQNKDWAGAGPMGPPGGRLPGQRSGMMPGRRGGGRVRGGWSRGGGGRHDSYSEPIYNNIPPFEPTFQGSGPWYGGGGGQDFGGPSGIDLMGNSGIGMSQYDAGGPGQKRDFPGGMQDPNLMRRVHGLNAFEQLNTVNSSPYPRGGLSQAAQHFPSQDDLSLYAQSNNFSLGGMGPDVSGLSRNAGVDALGMRPPMNPPPLVSGGMGMQFNPAVTAGLRDAALNQLQDPMQMSGQNHGQYGRPMPY